MKIAALITSCAALMGCGLAGCTTVDPDHRVVGRYFGYTRVLGPASQTEGLTVQDVTAVGGWIDGGSARGVSSVGLGFHRKRQAITEGRRCGLTVFVTSDTQLAAIETIIKTYAEGQACVTRANDQ